MKTLPKYSKALNSGLTPREQVQACSQPRPTHGQVLRRKWVRPPKGRLSFPGPIQYLVELKLAQDPAGHIPQD